MKQTRDRLLLCPAHLTPLCIKVTEFALRNVNANMHLQSYVSHIHRTAAVQLAPNILQK